MPANTSIAPNLYAVLLGGRAPGCRVELHDVAFAVGDGLPSLYPQLLAQWFGDPVGLHLDAWQALDRVDGFRIELKQERPSSKARLYFVNIGGYAPGEFLEQHAYAFLVADSKAAAKQQARSTLLPGREEVHKDDLYDIDDCVCLDQVSGWHVHLLADADARQRPANNGYEPLPARVIKAWISERAKK